MIITELFIPGRPITKGSLTVVNGVPKDTPQSKAWRRIMAGAVRDDLRRRQGGERPAAPAHPGPVHVDATWWLPVDPLAHGAGDLDKLLRNLLDALSAPGPRTTDRSLCASAIVDDNQVVSLATWKHCRDWSPGVSLKVESVES
jgi:hypothetical protein